MPTIELQTSIDAPRERVFDLCRSVDAHVATAEGTDERPVGGVTSGLGHNGPPPVRSRLCPTPHLRPCASRAAR